MTIVVIIFIRIVFVVTVVVAVVMVGVGGGRGVFLVRDMVKNHSGQNTKQRETKTRSWFGC